MEHMGSFGMWKLGANHKIRHPQSWLWTHKETTSAHKHVFIVVARTHSAALDKETEEKVAIKKVPKVFQDLVDGKRILREIKLLRTFKHDNIISVKDIMSIDNKEEFTDV